MRRWHAVRLRRLRLFACRWLIGDDFLIFLAPFLLVVVEWWVDMKKIARAPAFFAKTLELEHRTSQETLFGQPVLLDPFSDKRLVVPLFSCD